MAGKGNNLMAVRHDVENLIRRGNIFYWRARAPAPRGDCGNVNFSPKAEIISASDPY
ncbi:hypothetical protein [Rhizobium sp. CCGE 510]|uniref:hypothetical protein n=1 Tax=Rhizobium sp. CCGE 510 TaxID=1132836 RepID=UPI0002FB3230|nr:hypothetical protein [Rhizobium sp. CCGE 510]